MTTTNHSMNDQLWNEIDAFVQENDRKCDDQELRLLAERLQNEASSGMKNLWYPAGYAFYCIKSRISDPVVQASCEECLQNAIVYGYDSELAKVYLAFHNYDLGRYDCVTDYESDINYNRLDESVQVRYREACLCAQLRSRGLMESAPQIVAYAVYVRGLSNPDPMPFLLEQCFAAFSKSAFEHPSVRNAILKLDGAYEFMGHEYFSKRVFPR